MTLEYLRDVVLSDASFFGEMAKCVSISLEVTLQAFFERHVSPFCPSLLMTLETLVKIFFTLRERK